MLELKQMNNTLMFDIGPSQNFHEGVQSKLSSNSINKKRHNEDNTNTSKNTSSKKAKYFLSVNNQPKDLLSKRRRSKTTTLNQQEKHEVIGNQSNNNEAGNMFMQNQNYFNLQNGFIPNYIPNFGGFALPQHYPSPSFFAYPSPSFNNIQNNQMMGPQPPVFNYFDQYSMIQNQNHHLQQNQFPSKSKDKNKNYVTRSHNNSPNAKKRELIKDNKSNKSGNVNSKMNLERSEHESGANKRLSANYGSSINPQAVPLNNIPRGSVVYTNQGFPLFIVNNTNQTQENNNNVSEKISTRKYNNRESLGSSVNSAIPQMHKFAQNKSKKQNEEITKKNILKGKENISEAKTTNNPKAKVDRSIDRRSSVNKVMSILKKEESFPLFLNNVNNYGNVIAGENQTSMFKAGENVPNTSMLSPNKRRKTVQEVTFNKKPTIDSEIVKPTLFPSDHSLKLSPAKPRHKRNNSILNNPVKNLITSPSSDYISRRSFLGTADNNTYINSLLNKSKQRYDKSDSKKGGLVTQNSNMTSIFANRSSISIKNSGLVSKKSKPENESDSSYSDMEKEIGEEGHNFMEKIYNKIDSQAMIDNGINNNDHLNK
eukprot:CAMPEP_0170539194 /NCGR_PEP_ID=MMETSP0209-20121228/103772_1 /TAXON_ID=665100 ORGANISM="Litonotus pictus, Strain P1" /NCGR_SAMPLE_ID=MMETSP0209 /ASSEMBLY_ACC=CAM_ASM_000301 /LENGTH=595 /DNA_ID=CAMNT_0010841057 /DNA_START=4992 /DNA_END=6776 /DNA_ORIENTATION=+